MSKRNRFNVKTFIELFKKGYFEKRDVFTQIKAGWFDWYCNNELLAEKTKQIGKIISGIKTGGKIDLDNWYVWFKNNCPLYGNLYDDFRFSCLQSGDVQITIQIDCCLNEKKYTVWGRKSIDSPFETNHSLFEADSEKELLEWLNKDWN